MFQLNVDLFDIVGGIPDILAGDVLSVSVFFKFLLAGHLLFIMHVVLFLLLRDHIVKQVI